MGKASIVTHETMLIKTDEIELECIKRYPSYPEMSEKDKALIYTKVSATLVKRKRRQHYIHPVKPNITGRRVLFFDTESKFEKTAKGDKHRFWFCYLIDGYIDENGEYEPIYENAFLSLRAFWEYILDIPVSVWIYCHNFQFDGAIIDIDYFVDYYKLEPQRNKIVVDFGKVIIDVKHKDRILHFRDTLNYYPGSLASLAISIGNTKYLMPPTSDELDETWIAYCQHDTEIIRDFFIQYFKFVVDNGFQSITDTVASQSFAAYRNLFNSFEILCHDREWVIDLERLSYHGGRVECFYIGDIQEDIYKLDINSMYPYVMKQYQYPIYLEASYRYGTIELLKEALANDKQVVAEVIYDSDENAYGLYHNDKFIFPIGTQIRAVLTTPEIEHLLKTGRIRDVKRLAIYRKEGIFTEFVNYFYEMRLQNKENKVLSNFYKLMMNSLYGKFGQRNSDWFSCEPLNTDDKLVDVYDVDTGEHFSYRNILGQWQITDHSKSNADNACVAIASHVTAYARMYLYELICLAGKENVFYVDTDCLFVNASGFSNLSQFIDASSLGKLKNEGVFKSGSIFGNKDYELVPYTGKKTKKLKGIRAKAIEIAPNTYSQVKFNKWSVSSGRGETGSVLVQNIVKSLRRNYTKGVILDNGTVIPHTISGEEFITE